jgi:hypothetical protein
MVPDMFVVADMKASGLEPPERLPTAHGLG